MRAAAGLEEVYHIYQVKEAMQNGDYFKMEKGMVSALMTKEEFGAAQSEKIIEESFDGSLPAFIAAFASRKRLSLDDVDEIQKMIDSYRVEGE